tara:strand:+ start:27 stop:446 length:420 start_codon:yes stop_codon:yes gene_type:complete
MKFLLEIWQKLKWLQCEGRVEKNKDHEAPSFKEMFKLSERSQETGWFMMPPWNNIFHDDNKGLPEIKFSHLDGREYIYGPKDNSHSSEYIFIEGSYNYFSVCTNVKYPWKFLVLTYLSIMHFLADMLFSWIVRCPEGKK